MPSGGTSANYFSKYIKVCNQNTDLCIVNKSFQNLEISSLISKLSISLCIFIELHLFSKLLVNSLKVNFIFISVKIKIINPNNNNQGSFYFFFPSATVYVGLLSLPLHPPSQASPPPSIHRHVDTIFPSKKSPGKGI